MTSRERMLAALEGRRPDRLPVTTHHLMPWFLETWLEGISEQAFFQRFGLDSVRWVYDLKPDESRGEYVTLEEDAGPGAAAGPKPGSSDLSRSPLIVSGEWQIQTSPLSGRSADASGDGRDLHRYDITTPGGNLTMVLEKGPQTDWVVERPLKEKEQIELFHRYAPWGLCDTEAVVRKGRELGDRGILRGSVPGFQIYGQPGCWQDAVELFGLEKMILATLDDPLWVREFLGMLRERKLAAVESMVEAPFDLIELGGGSASSTVISPSIFQEFVAPYDQPLIEAAHEAGFRVVYHTCGGMMPLLELIADMGPDAMETFTPPALGGDADLREAKERIGDRVCMIGGFDQHTFFQGCTPEETRKAVRRCFQEAGGGGGFILAPSDHFFDAEPRLLEAFAEEARECRYGCEGIGHGRRGSSPVS